MTKAIAKRGQPTVLAMLDRYKDQIARALPRHMSVDRMVRIVMTEIRRTPQLLEADPASLFGAVIQAAQLGLEPGVNGQAHLVPFRNGRTGRIEAQFIPGYKGLMDLARRSGKVRTITARVVREGDLFEYALGTDEFIRHVPRSGPDAEVVAAYAVAVLEDGTKQVEVMLREEIDRIRQRSKAASSGPWVTDYEEMARKTVVRRICKYLPASVELATAVALDEAAEGGRSQRNEAILDMLPVDALVEREAEAEGSAKPGQTAPSKPTASRTESLKARLQKNPVEQSVATGLALMDAHGAVVSVAATEALWLQAFRSLIRETAPDDRPAVAKENIGVLRDIVQNGPEALRPHAAKDLEAAEALAASAEEPEQPELLG